MSGRTQEDQAQLDALEAKLRADHAQDAADAQAKAAAAAAAPAEPVAEPSPEPAAEPTPTPEPAPLVLNILDREDAPELPEFVASPGDPAAMPFFPRGGDAQRAHQASLNAADNAVADKLRAQSQAPRRPSTPTDPTWPNPHPFLRAVVRYTMADLSERSALVLSIDEFHVAVLNVHVALSSDDRIQTQQVAAVPYGAVGEALTWHEAGTA